MHNHLRVFIVGCGDIGLRTAAILKQQPGMTVIGIVRSTPSCERLQQNGIDVIQCDLQDPINLTGITWADALVYYFVPPPPTGLSDTYMTQFLAQLTRFNKPQQIVYLSTSGVYGDCRGNWVDETWPTSPQQERSIRRLNAEQQLQTFCQMQQVKCVILRVGGIYGPGRLPIARLSQGLPILNEHESPYSNRIHADDLAQIAVTAAIKAPHQSVYNVSDGCPSSISDYFNRVADLLGFPRPPAISWEQAPQNLTSALYSYLQESRRLRNDKMCQELGITLKYPNLELGLHSIDPQRELAAFRGN